MTPLLLSLLPLAFVEITAFTRIAVLGGYLGARDRPLVRASAFVAGVFACYMVLGLLFAFGLGRAIEEAGDRFANRIINPENIDYGISLVIGLILLFAAWRMIRKRENEVPAPPDAADSGSRDGVFKAFLVGFTMNLIVGPNTLCSFAAYNQILKAELDALTTLLFLVGFNLLIVSPLLLLIQISVANREGADRVFARLRDFVSKGGRRVGPFILVLIALILLADSIGFFIGHPLIPTGESPGSGDSAAIVFPGSISRTPLV